jgi:uncharacterized protein YndB with AHSA1/START domain
MGERSEDLTLAMKRELPAARARVFRAFVRPDEIARWFGPKGYTIPSVEFRPSVGEHYRIEVQPPDGERFYVAGEVREVDAPSRLGFTFVYEEPTPDDVETQVALSFLDRGESTDVDLTQGLFRTKERRALHHDGWSDSFDKLERFIRLQP